jgi:prophage regulatory protein
MMQTHPQQKTLLRRPDVERRTGLSRSTIYARMAAGKFPQAVSLGRAVAWVEAEIDAWIEERIQTRQIKAA